MVFTFVFISVLKAVLKPIQASPFTYMLMFYKGNGNKLNV